MKKKGKIIQTLVGITVLVCVALMIQGQAFLDRVSAQLPTAMPTEDVTETPLTPPPTNTDSPNPTPTSIPTNTDTPPTAQPTNTHTPTTAPPATSTHTPTTAPTPTNTIPAATRPPTQPTTTPEPTKKPKPQPNPSCQSRVSGTVSDAAGKGLVGATVTIEGDGWSSGILTDDHGDYGFGGLCAGSATVRAYAPNGQAGQSATVQLTGENIVQLNLSTQAAQSSAATGAATGQPAAGQTPTPEPEMPATGYSGWLLLGGALLGALLLLTAGIRRVLVVQERTKSRD